MYRKVSIKRIFVLFAAFCVSPSLWASTGTPSLFFNTKGDVSVSFLSKDEAPTLPHTFVWGTRLPLAPVDSMHYPLSTDGSSQSPLFLKPPENIKTEVVYNAKTNSYVILKKVGDLVVEKKYLTFEEYQQYDMDKMIADYWHNRSSTSGNTPSSGGDGLLNNLIPQLNVKNELFETIFGGSAIDIRTTGSAELTFAVMNNTRHDNAININQRSTTSFDFNEQIQLNVQAQIGKNIGFNFNYNTEATFSFENELKLKYEGKEDDIVQLVEAGDVSFPLPTRLISGAQNLFGAKTKLKFGHLTVDAVFGEQKSETNNIKLQGGAQMTEALLTADEYEENRHYFLGQYFYENYNEAMSHLPVINSNVNIIKIEVWRTNIGSAVQENRNLIAVSDLGEQHPHSSHISPGISRYPNQNTSNNFLQTISPNALRNINVAGGYLQGRGLVSGQDYEKVESARRLLPSEYSYNGRLGFISLNQPLGSDQVLAVAYRYQLIGDTAIYQVGEFSDEGVSDPNTLVVKLLKSTTVNTANPLWKLMMKNVYSLSAYQVNPKDFRLNILYSGDLEGVPTGYFAEGPQQGIPLIQVLGFDRMDYQQNPHPDGVFDFIDNADTEGGTIVSNYGRIYFPTVEPFGKDLRATLNNDPVADRYCYDSLYSMTKSQAQQYTEKNKYTIEVLYKSSAGSEIRLGGINIPQGSVKVMAGGIVLVEGVDYTVDYQMGLVRIINEGYLNSSTPLTVSSESSSTFSPMTKYMLGLRANYELSNDFHVGMSFLSLNEGTVTRKINYGDEPISNMLWGLDLEYKTEIPFLTRMLDWLPFYQTKTRSFLNLSGEFAHFIPGHSKAIGTTGTAYIDDFEGSSQTQEMKTVGMWYLASTPQDFASNGALFPETDKNLGLEYGYNRALLSWYSIDDIFYSSSAPRNITQKDRSQPYVRQILQKEVFPNKDIASGFATTVREFNLAFYPEERGPYNYDVGSAYSAGVNVDGTLKNPASRWGGIMRKLDATDFDATNIEYIEFWMMDPFIDNTAHSGGKLYFNLGDISEDILRDGRKSFENGLPTSDAVVNVDTTIWGRVPNIQAIVNAFDNNPNARKFQDVGYDGLSSEDEASFFQNFLNTIQPQITPDAFEKLQKDPSSDDFRYFRGSDFDNNNVKILERYKRFSAAENNSPTSDQSSEAYSTQSTSLPNVEDINQDNTLSEAENYYQYEIELAPGQMEIGKNYITDIQESVGIELPDGSVVDCKWYQFKIPVRNPDKKVGAIEGFQSIRFMRMFLRDFAEPIVLRFATLELVRGEWRKYNQTLLEPGAYPSGSSTEKTIFTVATVNIEENGRRSPVPYVIPKGIEREKLYTNTSYQQQNEQSLSMRTLNLEDGDARAIYKRADLDMRQYKKLRMFVHAEKAYENDVMKEGDLSLFIRLGSDYTQNYYEYELPLQFTPWHTPIAEVSAIWPEANEIAIDLERLVKVKEHRNAAIRAGDLSIMSHLPYVEYEGNRKMAIVGSPSISSLKVIMIGVRNPRKRTLDDDDDMLPKSAEIWVNELRLTDFKTNGGWAVTGAARTNLADLGDLSVAGSFTTAGFGSIEQRIATLSQEQIGTFDVSTTIEFGKFIPEKFGIQLPVHFDHSRITQSPRYNPLDPDVYLANDLKSYRTGMERDSVRNMVQDLSSTTNLNMMNVRKERVGEKALERRFYQIENWSVSYSYSQQYHRDVDVEFNQKEQHRGLVSYSYDFASKPFTPFKNIGFFKSNYLALFRDLELSYRPQRMSFSSEMTRDVEETLLRAKSMGNIIMTPFYNKQFLWYRRYDLAYNPTGNIRLNYEATMNALIHEPRGRIDTRDKKDSVWKNIREFGVAQQYNQKLTASWNVPIHKIPLLSWTRLNVSYRSDFSFLAATEATKRLGNTIENSNNLTIGAEASLRDLFLKVKFVKKAHDAKFKPKPMKQLSAKKKPEEKTPPDPNEKSFMSRVLEETWNTTVRFLTGVRTVSATYADDQGTLIPGFMPSAQWLGMDSKAQWAPGPGFVFGSQRNIMQDALQNEWISRDSLMNAAFQQKRNQRWNGKVVIEPFNRMNIDLTFMQAKSRNYRAYYKYNSAQDEVVGPISPFEEGNFSSSIWSFWSIFEPKRDDNGSEVFDKFLKNRNKIANRLSQTNQEKNPGSYTGTMLQDSVTGAFFPDGYNRLSQQVLIPAFLAAYTNQDPNKIEISPFAKIPMPNWTISYSGLGELAWVKKWANGVTLTNRYASDYTVSAYSSDPRVPLTREYDYGTEWIRNEADGNFIAREVVDQVMIRERFEPLMKIDINLKNSFQTNFEMRTMRTMTLSFSNTQLIEVSQRSLSVGLGYRFKDVKISIRSGESVRTFKSDIVLQANLTRNVNKTTLRKLDQSINLISSGMEVYAINFSGDYALSEKITLRAFFETTINTPYISNSAPNSNTRGGFTVRITL